jgi:two-component system invasion response regulator UvrY
MARKIDTDQTGRRKNVLIVDRHALMRFAAARWINSAPGLRVCGMAGGMAEAFKAVQRLQPDIVVSEIMRVQDLAFIQELRQRHPRLPILVFTIQDQAICGERAWEAGADGYLMKEAGGEALVRRIKAVLEGRSRGHRPSAAVR